MLYFSGSRKFCLHYFKSSLFIFVTVQIQKRYVYSQMCMY